LLGGGSEWWVIVGLIIVPQDLPSTASLIWSNACSRQLFSGLNAVSPSIRYPVGASWLILVLVIWVALPTNNQWTFVGSW